MDKIKLKKEIETTGKIERTRVANENDINRILKKICNKDEPKQSQKGTKTLVYWWNNEIAIARAECIKRQRISTRTASLLERKERGEERKRIHERHKERYRSARKELRTLIKKIKEKAW